MKTLGSSILGSAAMILSGVLMVSCTSTRLETSWKAPEAGTLQFQKVMVLAAAPDGALRRTAEDAMKQQIEKAEAIASYELIPDVESVKDRVRVAEAIERANADGLVVMRLISDDTEVSYQPGMRMPSPYTSFWGYYTRSYALAPFYWETQADAYVTERVIGIETNIYNARDEALVWSGFTRTRDPRSIEQLVAEVAGVVRARLREQGLIQ